MAGSSYPKQHIPDEDFIFRNIHNISYKSWTPKRRPNEADFKLKPGETDGLSVSWEKYCPIDQLFILLGLSKKKDGVTYLNPKEFKAIKLNVGQVRSLVLSEGAAVIVDHDPTDFNQGHSLICCDDNDELRLKLCDLVESQEKQIYVPDNFEDILRKVDRIKSREKFSKKIGNDKIEREFHFQGNHCQGAALKFLVTHEDHSENHKIEIEIFKDSKGNWEIAANSIHPEWISEYRDDLFKAINDNGIDS